MKLRRLQWEISWRFLRVWLRNVRVWRRFWVSNLLYNFIEPIMYLAALGFGVGRYVTGIAGLPYEVFIASGIIASSAMFAASFENSYGTYIRLEFEKTFDAIIATPVSADEVALGEILYGATKSAAYGSLVLVVISALGLVPVWRPWLLLVPLVALLIGLVFAALAVVVAATVPNIEAFTYFISMGIMPMFFFSGIFFPLADLPAVAQGIAWFTPLMHGVRVMRALTLGHDTAVLGDVLWLLAAAAPLTALAIQLVRRRLLR